MRRAAGECKLHLHVGKSGRCIDSVARVGMPVKHGVKPLKHALAHHICLAAATLLGRAAEQFDGTLVPRGEPFSHRHCARYGTGAQQIMAAAVPVGSLHESFAVSNRILRHTRERVILGHHADDRRALTVAGHESRGNTGNASFDLKAFTFKERGPLLRTLALVVGRLGIVPDTLLERVVEVETAFQVAKAGGRTVLHCLAPAGRPRREHRRAKHKQEHNYSY